VLLVGIVAGVLLRWDPSGVRSLFAGVAALAMPHLLVTPYFDRVVRRPGSMGLPRAHRDVMRAHVLE